MVSPPLPDNTSVSENLSNNRAGEAVVVVVPMAATASVVVVVVAAPPPMGRVRRRGLGDGDGLTVGTGAGANAGAALSFLAQAGGLRGVDRRRLAKAAGWRCLTAGEDEAVGTADAAIGLVALAHSSGRIATTSGIVGALVPVFAGIFRSLSSLSTELASEAVAAYGGVIGAGSSSRIGIPKVSALLNAANEAKTEVSVTGSPLLKASFSIDNSFVIWIDDSCSTCNVPASCAWAKFWVWV